MSKKILALGSILAVLAGIAAMSAFEAHVINVTAHIENALYVHPEGLEFGTVFPQEYVEGQFTVALSKSFQGAERVDDVVYVIKQKPKCECIFDAQTQPEDYQTYCTEGDHAPVDYATHECPVHPDGTQAYVEMENLCQFLSKVDADPEDENDTDHPSYYIDPDNDPANPDGDEYCQQPIRIDNQLAFSPGGWAGWSCPAGTHVVGGGYNAGASVAISEAAQPGSISGLYPVYPHYTYTPPETGWVIQNDNDNEVISYYVLCLTDNPDATGYLSKFDSDLSDLWTVDLKVPPVEGYVGQDWPAGCPTVPTNDVDYGCDLWIEVTCISEKPGDCPPVE